VSSVPPIALGCGNFGGVGSAPAFFGQGTDEETAVAIMDAAWAGGIRWFDTADAYGGWRSETFVGRWRTARGADGLRLTTKVFHSTEGIPGDTGLGRDRVLRQLESSLARLGVGRVDLYLAHQPDPGTPIGETVATFEELAAEEVIGAWGLSNVDAAGIAAALEHGRPALVQNAYSLLEPSDEEAVIPLCAEHGIAYQSFSPLAGGWLTGKYRRGEPFPEGSRMTQRPGPYLDYVDERVFAGLDLLRVEADDRRVDLPTIALAWVLASPDVAGLVCGPTRPEHLAPVFAALDVELTAGDRLGLGSLFEGR
jgi:aryl-alcohol dehydrogenase-like predicted oxidoreductase